MKKKVREKMEVEEFRKEQFLPAGFWAALWRGPHIKLCAQWARKFNRSVFQFSNFYSW